MADNLTNPKLADLRLSTPLPAAAKDVTVGDMIALAWGKTTPKVAALTVKDLADVSDALKARYSNSVQAEPVGSSCCCCCTPCCCCAPCCSCCI